MRLERMSLFTTTMVAMVVSGDDKWFWNCDYRIVDLDLERGLVFLHDQKANKLLSYNISVGKLNEIQDAFGWDRYYVYIPCYSELPAQETSVQ